MDIDFLRTFLEVNRTKHFAKASKNLFVTQSTISSRIKFIEESLRVKLFTRNRNDIQLTQAGLKLLPQAEQIVSQWDELKKKIINSETDLFSLTVASISSLWDIFLNEWIVKLKNSFPGLIFRGESIGSDSQIRSLLARTIDIGFMFDPPQISDLNRLEISKVELVLVSTTKNISIFEAINQNYVSVDWGPSFQADHLRTFPDILPPKTSFDLGRWAVNYLLLSGGSAYLAKEMIKNHLIAKQIYLVEGAPVFKQSFQALFNKKSKNLDLILKSLDLFQENNGFIN